MILGIVTKGIVEAPFILEVTSIFLIFQKIVGVIIGKEEPRSFPNKKGNVYFKCLLNTFPESPTKLTVKCRSQSEIATAKIALTKWVQNPLCCSDFSVVAAIFPRKVADATKNRSL